MYSSRYAVLIYTNLEECLPHNLRLVTTGKHHCKYRYQHVPSKGPEESFHGQSEFIIIIIAIRFIF